MITKHFGEHVGITLYYNGVILSIEYADMCRLQYVAHVVNHNEIVYLDYLFVDHLLYLQETIKEITEKGITK